VRKAESPIEIVARRTGDEGFDFVFDTAGGASLDVAFVVVKRFGNVAFVRWFKEVKAFQPANW